MFLAGCVVFVCRVFQGLTEQPRYGAECGGACGDLTAQVEDGGI